MQSFLLSLADGAAPAAGPAGCAGGGLQSMLPIVLMFVIVYFMMIRPQQKKANEHKNFLAGLKKGDQIITRGGVIGKITGVADNMVTIEVQEKVRVRVLKSYIDGAFKEGQAPVAVRETGKDDKGKDKEAAGTPASS